jgi:LmbE family N-acetylglucosaminyl deacetylase
MIEKDESLPTTLDAARFRLLAVIAHPDDETLAVGGTLALYTQRGCWWM